MSGELPDLDVLPTVAVPSARGAGELIQADLCRNDLVKLLVRPVKRQRFYSFPPRPVRSLTGNL